jgi:hypothetical protein
MNKNRPRRKSSALLTRKEVAYVLDRNRGFAWWSGMQLLLLAGVQATAAATRERVEWTTIQYNSNIKLVHRIDTPLPAT